MSITNNAQQNRQAQMVFGTVNNYYMGSEKIEALEQKTAAQEARLNEMSRMLQYLKNEQEA